MKDINSIEFTRASEEKFYDVVDLNDFSDKDAGVIFECLKKELHLIPFGDYLKRYIYKKAGMSGDYDKVDLRDYQQIIAVSFKETDTPRSFNETTAKMGAITKKWLTQSSVSRQTVFLLGFGLGMSVEDVADFLIKAQRERSFNFKDPYEIIYWYCFKCGYKFQRAVKLKELYDRLKPTDDDTVYNERTTVVRNAVLRINSDQALLDYLAQFKSGTNRASSSVTTFKYFSDLYLNCREIIAGFRNRDELEKAEEERKVYTAADITNGDVEDVLCCGTPKDKSGNLKKLATSTISNHFSNKRMSRQHLQDVLSGETQADRFDLITLNFFIFSQDGELDNSKARYSKFIESTNMILNDCAMGELYVTNPYECFLLMCMLSDGPLATYADVWDMSFNG